MIKVFAPVLLGAVCVGAAFALAPQQPPEMPKPVKEHEWLKQIEGEWETTGEMQMAPDQPVIKSKGIEKNRMNGAFWLVSNQKGECMGMTMECVFTLGYDPSKKKYVGTWIDNMTPHLWSYEGEVDSAGKTLTLLTKGPDPMAPGKTRNFKEVLTIKDKDHRTFTSSMQGDDGKWTTFVKMESKRKK
jgi:hypothetical protein